MDMRLRLYFDEFGQIPVPVPPVDEQRRVVSFYFDATEDTDRTINRTRCEIDLLREYRTRLIADVVTGKLDVRDAAARLPDEIDEVESPDDTEPIPEDAEVGDNTDLDAASEEAEV
jgi:type I restriction enzyme S subunit